MKKVLTLLVVFAVMTTSFASVTVEVSPKKAIEILIPIGTSGKQISLMELSLMSVKEYQQLTGNKLKLTEKLAFKLTQSELKKLINTDGTINSKRLQNLEKKMAAAADNRRNLRLALIFLAIGVVFSILSYVTGFFWILASLAYLASAVFFVI